MKKVKEYKVYDLKGSHDDQWNDVVELQYPKFNETRDELVNRIISENKNKRILIYIYYENETKVEKIEINV